MVKLFSLSVHYKGPGGVKPLLAVYDLMSFGFFQRGNAQEFMAFSANVIVERTDPGTRQSVKQGDHMCHCYVRSDNLAGVVISDSEYPHRVAHTLLMQILDDFAAKVPPTNWPSGTNIQYAGLEPALVKYQNPKEADALTKIQADLDETRIIMHNTIEAVLQRGEKLDDLVAKSQNLSDTSKMFYKTAKKTNSCCNWV